MGKKMREGKQKGKRKGKSKKGEKQGLGRALDLRTNASLSRLTEEL